MHKLANLDSKTDERNGDCHMEMNYQLLIERKISLIAVKIDFVASFWLKNCKLSIDEHADEHVLNTIETKKWNWPNERPLFVLKLMKSSI